jgi:hypothetical protein
MTTRRTLFIIAGGAVAAAGSATLVGRGAFADRSAQVSGPVDVPDVVVAGTEAGLTVLAGTRRRALGRAAVAGDTVFTVTEGTSLIRLGLTDGVASRSIAVGDGWIPRVVSGDGGSCALGRTPASVRPAARASSPLLVTADGRQRRYDLSGVIEPDAFTTDGAGLFVLEWMPASAPDRYRVRLLDLATGVLQPLLTRAKTPVPAGAEEEMRGDGRQAVLSPGRQVLYTLYTHQRGHQHTRNLISGRPSHVHAFVHVLHLTERWAYCLDLPRPFGEGPAEGHAIAISPDGRRLAVVDTNSGSLAYADTEALTISRVVRRFPVSGAASLLFGPDLLVGVGTEVTVLDSVTDKVKGNWPVPSAVRGLGLSRDGSRVYVGGAGEVVWLDARSGAVQGRAAVPGLTGLHHVG